MKQIFFIIICLSCAAPLYALQVSEADVKVRVAGKKLKDREEYNVGGLASVENQAAVLQELQKLKEPMFTPPNSPELRPTAVSHPRNMEQQATLIIVSAAGAKKISSKTFKPVAKRTRKPPRVATISCIVM